MTYKERFAQLVAQIIDNVKQRKNEESLRFAYSGVGYDLADREQRIVLIGRITEDYVTENGESPKSTLIERLTDAILDEELTDPDPYKVEHNEYPILSNIQLDRRRGGRRGSESTNMSGETHIRTDEDDDTSESHARSGVYLASDGRDYRNPIRRTRSISELIYVDTNAKIRNVERSAQYKRDTAPSPIVTYNVRENGGEFTNKFTTAKGVAETWRERLSLVY